MRARGFRVLLPARSGPEAGRVAFPLNALGALRGFFLLFGGGSGELIAASPGVPVLVVFPSVFAPRHRDKR